MPRKLIKKLQIGFGISLLILIASSAASYFSIRKQIKARENFLRTQRIILSANQILIDLQNAETGQRGFYLTNDETFLEPYHHSVRSLPQSLKETRELVKRNELQSSRVDSISLLVHMRLNILTDLTNIRRRGENISLQQLEAGKAYMDSCRNIITRFIQTENQQLDEQGQQVSSITAYTSTFIVLAAIFSLAIALTFYFRIHRELKKREKLQEAIRRKDEDLVRRLAIVRGIAKSISSGDYSVRVTDHEKDALGEIGNALNEMSRSLEKSFEKINNNEWKQAGLAGLNDTLVGNKNPEAVAHDALAHLVNYGKNANGAIYLPEDDDLVLRGSYGLEHHMTKRFVPGEGTIGQVFKDKCTKLWENIGHNDYIVSFSAGQLRISHILWLPLVLKDTCFGVIELGSLKSFEPHEIAFYEEACRIITLGIAAANSRKNAQTLLEETQAQSEELLVQHNELEKLNTELEAQAQKLQASEEELRAQQEDLLQSNHELEERSRLLREKNTLIAQRNVEIQKKAAELALSTRYKSEFLANMSHELRTPLNSILLLSRLLAENMEKNLSSEQVKSAQVIQSSGLSLLSLIDEILDLSKIEAGKMELDYQKVEITALCKGLDDMFAPVTAQKGLSFDIRIDPLLPESIETDQLRLEQVLRNLLNNAIKFTANGGITLRVSEDPAKKDFVLFSVKDTGIGISQEHRHVIFEAFRQADGTTKRKYGGTGLGLSICREITHLLGGEISLRSSPGEGSDFTVSIPAKQAIADQLRSGRRDAMEKLLPGIIEAPDAPDEAGRADKLPEIREEITGEDNTVRDIKEAILQNPGKVLIVEENPKHAEALSYFLGSFDVGVEIKDTVEDCITALLSADVSCVILDMAVPDKMGYETLEAVRKNKGLENVSIIIFTGRNLSGAEELKIRKYADSIVIKTVHSFRRILDEIGFFLHLPAESETRKKPGKTGRLGSLPEVLKGKTVLMADDDPRNIFSVTRTLEAYQMKVIAAIDGKEALEKLRNAPSIAVVLMDIMMPEMDGYKTIMQIRSMPEYARLPIIAVTAKAMTGDREKCIRAGASDYISKPVDTDQLLSLLRVWLYEP